MQDQAKQQKLAAKKEAEEALYWSQGAHHNARKEAEEAKRLERLARKRERELLEKAEREQISPRSPPPTLHNAGRREVRASSPAPLSTASSALSSKSSSLGGGATAVYAASNIDDALELLDAATSKPATASVEKHPERRMEAAYKRFEELEMPLLKLQNPSLRHSQLKERLYRLWRKSPENPMNQTHISHRATREQETAFLLAQNAAKLEQFRLQEDNK